MKYVTLGCVTIDNIINAYGVKQLNQFGGNAAYGAMGIRLWESGTVGIVARAGNDYPMEWIRELSGLGIDTNGIRSVNKRHTMFSGMIYNENGDRREVTFDEDCSSDEADLIEGFLKMTPDEVSSAHEDFAPKAEDIPEAYADAEGVMIGARHYDRQMAYINWFRQRNPGVKIVMDTGLDYMRPEKAHLLPALFSKADVVIPSWDEICRLFPEGCSPEEAVLRLRALGAPTAVVKLGGKGCIICDSQGVIHRTPAYHLSGVTDPTGAGDSFCGGFTVGLVETGDPIQAAMYGAVSASYIISAFGVLGTRDITRQMAQTRLEALNNAQEADSHEKR